MFAQLLITSILVLGLAEGMSRWLLGRSLWAFVEEALSDSQEKKSSPSAEASLEALVQERREALAAARRQVRLAHRAASVTDDLSASTDDLMDAEERLAAAERRLVAELEDETRVLG
ncbi:MAG: hypothetical protein K0U98_11840 [Deltaproteobacteria bacterium]|nr:hypothetical protein [Deltaproteobacteria bacterium]